MINMYIIHLYVYKMLTNLGPLRPSLATTILLVSSTHTHPFDTQITHQYEFDHETSNAIVILWCEILYFYNNKKSNNRIVGMYKLIKWKSVNKQHFSNNDWWWLDHLKSYIYNNACYV